MAGMDHHRLFAADAVQIEVHRTHAADLGRKLHAFHQPFAQGPLFVGIEVTFMAVEHNL